MKIVVDHTLEKNDAKERIKNLLTNLKNEHGDKISNVEEKWNDSSADFGFKIMGMQVKGKLEIGEKNVKVNGNLPLAALPFKGLVERTIKEKAQELLKN